MSRYSFSEEIEVLPEHKALAERLVTSGWIQISSKYRRIRRWKSTPSIEEIIRPEYLHTYFAEQMKKWLNFHYDSASLRCAPDELVEELILSIPEFKAFRELKNKPWRDYLDRAKTEAING